MVCLLCRSSQSSLRSGARCCPSGGAPRSARGGRPRWPPKGRARRGRAPRGHRPRPPPVGAPLVRPPARRAAAVAGPLPPPEPTARPLRVVSLVKMGPFYGPGQLPSGVRFLWMPVYGAARECCALRPPGTPLSAKEPAAGTRADRGRRISTETKLV